MTKIGRYSRGVRETTETMEPPPAPIVSEFDPFASPTVVPAVATSETYSTTQSGGAGPSMTVEFDPWGAPPEAAPTLQPTKEDGSTQKLFGSIGIQSNPPRPKPRPPTPPSTVEPSNSYASAPAAKATRGRYSDSFSEEEDEALDPRLQSMYGAAASTITQNVGKATATSGLLNPPPSGSLLVRASTRSLLVKDWRRLWFLFEVPSNASNTDGLATRMQTLLLFRSPSDLRAYLDLGTSRFRSSERQRLVKLAVPVGDRHSVIQF